MTGGKGAGIGGSVKGGNDSGHNVGSDAVNRACADYVASAGDHETSGIGDRTGEDPVVIKKYANRRLYDTEASAYVTLASLAAMAREGKEFVVRDARSGEDITRSVLVQIILESENRGESQLPIDFLRGLAGMYGDAMQWALPNYLESAMEVFLRNQEALRSQMNAALSSNPAKTGFDHLAQANREVYEHTMRMFSPFGGGREVDAEDAASVEPPASAEEIASLRSQLEQVQGRLDQIAGEPEEA